MNQGERLQKLRTDRGLSVAELAEKLNVSRQYIHMLERGGKRISTRMIAAYSRFFSVSTDYLLGTDQGNVVPLFRLGTKQEGLSDTIAFPFRLLGKNKKYFAVAMDEPDNPELVIFEQDSRISLERTGFFLYHDRYYYSCLQQYEDGSLWLISGNRASPEQISALNEVRVLGYQSYRLVRTS